MNTLLPTSTLQGSKAPPKLKFKYPQNTYNIIIAQQSLPPLKHQYLLPTFDVTKRFEESLEKCRKKHEKQKLKLKAIEQVKLSRQLSENILESYRKNDRNNLRLRCTSESFDTREILDARKQRRASELVDQLLFDIYGKSNFKNGSSERLFETEYGSSSSFNSVVEKYNEKFEFSRLILKDVTELRILIGSLRERVTYAGNLLVKQLKKRDALKSKEEKICNVITAHLHAYSDKRSEDTNMRFSPNAIPSDSGFNQWRDAMKMVAKLPGGIPAEFRRKLWIALAERYLQSKGINWERTEKLCFNEWSNPDDSELGIQIVKDLHRTGCSLFCGAAGQENQALLKRVLLAYARWNKNVGYCQGFNMLAALILQVMDKNETDSVKVMIYLIEGVLPESYFANNLRGLSVDMIVFRDLLKMRLPQLSKHLEALQIDAREGNSYEPPLTNVFTMQWFLTLFCNCLPQSTVLRVWDLIFLEGNEILLRTAIAIWEKLSDRILAVNSADEFYSIMGVLTREMLEFGLVDSNTLIKSIVAIGTCSELNEMRDRYLYNITPWTQSVQTAAKKGFKLFYSDDDDVESDYDEKAAVTAAYGISIGRKRDKHNSNSKDGTTIQPYAHGHPDRERLALDISALKKQYAKLRERQRQAHIILQAACARQPMGHNSSSQPIAMNHLLLGKTAIVNSRGRRLGPPKGSIPPARTKEHVKKKEPVPSGETIQWKDTAKFRRRQSCTEESDTSQDTFIPESDSSSYSEDEDSSTSTELCDEPGRMSDFDSDDKFCDFLESKRTIKSSKHNHKVEKLPIDSGTKSLGDFSCSEVAEVQSEFRELINDINELNTSENSDLKKLQMVVDNEPTNIFSSPKSNDDLLFSNCAKNEETTSINATTNKIKLNTEDLLNLNDIIPTKNEEIETKNIDKTPVKEYEDTFETFLQERVKILKENSSDSLTSPKNEQPSRRSSEERLRRHKSYEESSNNHLDKSVIFKQQSFDIGVLPTIETSLWKPYQIEEESPREEIVDLLQQDDNEILEETNQSKGSVDLLTVEDKRLEAGRRNSERALKIIQENSLILHRILQQQKSSEKEDSEDELSRSPISKTFLRSESLLSKDEKTDEDRSSKDGDDELESGVESFSVSPALLDEESDRSMKKDTFEDQDETLIISKNEDTEYSYKYQSSDNTSNIISSSIFEDSSLTKNDTNLQTSPTVASFSHTTFEDYSPNMCEESAKFDIASNILDYSKDNEDYSSLSIQSDNKYTVDKCSNIEENTNKIVEDSEDISPYRISFKYKEDSVDNIKITTTEIEDTSANNDKASFLSSSQNVSSSLEKEENILLVDRSSEITHSKYSDEFLLYLNKSNDISSSKEETKSYLQDSKEDMLVFKISEDEKYNTKHKSLRKDDISSLTKEETKLYLPDSKEDIISFKITEDDKYSPRHKTWEDDVSSMSKDETKSNLPDSKEDMLIFRISDEDDKYTPKHKSYEKSDISSMTKEETKSYLQGSEEDMISFKISENDKYSPTHKPYEKEEISSLTNEEIQSYILDSKEDILSFNVAEDNKYSPSTKEENTSYLPDSKEENTSYLPDSKEDNLIFKISEDDKYSLKHKSYDKDDISSLSKEETKSYLPDSKEDMISFKISEGDKYSPKHKPNENDDISSLTKEEIKSYLPDSKEDMLSFKTSADKYSPKHNIYSVPYEKENRSSSLFKEEIKSYLTEIKEDTISFKLSTDENIPKQDTYCKFYKKDDLSSSLPKEEPKFHIPEFKEDTNRFKLPKDEEIPKHDTCSKSYKKEDLSSSLPKEETKSYLSKTTEDIISFKLPKDDDISKQDTYSKSYKKEDLSSSLPKEETKFYLPETKEDTVSYKLPKDDDISKQDTYSKSYKKEDLSLSLPREETKSFLLDAKEDTISHKLPKDEDIPEQDTYSKSYKKEDLSSFSYTKSPEHSSPYKYRFREDSDDNITNKYSSYLQTSETASSKYYNKTDTFPSSYKTEYSCDEQLSSEETLDKYSKTYKDDTCSSKYNYASKFDLNSPEYIAQKTKSSLYIQDSPTVSSSIAKCVDKIVTDSTDNNTCEARPKSPEYQHNKNKLTIELAPAKYGEYSPEISPPKHLSCLQFTTFQTDIPCTSKSIQFSPICTKDNNEKSPQKMSPTKCPKYFSNFNLPTLSPPRRTVKTPLSPNKTFNPFPVQPTTRQPKELGVKLGLYKDLINPLKSPTK